MKQIKKGSLVCAFRRSYPGVGLVIHRERDLVSYLKIDVELLHRRKEIENSKDLTGRVTMEWWGDIEEQITNSTNQQVAKEFLAYNHYGRKKVLKKDFSYVKWIKKPSEFAQIIHDKEGWIPSDWLRVV